MIKLKNQHYYHFNLTLVEYIMAARESVFVKVSCKFTDIMFMLLHCFIYHSLRWECTRTSMRKRHPIRSSIIGTAIQLWILSIINFKVLRTIPYQHRNNKKSTRRWVLVLMFFLRNPPARTSWKVNHQKSRTTRRTCSKQLPICLAMRVSHLKGRVMDQYSSSRKSLQMLKQEN